MFAQLPFVQSKSTLAVTSLPAFSFSAWEPTPCLRLFQHRQLSSSLLVVQHVPNLVCPARSRREVLVPQAFRYWLFIDIAVYPLLLYPPFLLLGVQLRAPGHLYVGPHTDSDRDGAESEDALDIASNSLKSIGSFSLLGCAVQRNAPCFKFLRVRRFDLTYQLLRATERNSDNSATDACISAA